MNGGIGGHWNNTGYKAPYPPGKYKCKNCRREYNKPKNGKCPYCGKE